MTTDAAAPARAEASGGRAGPTDTGEADMPAMKMIIALCRTYNDAREALQDVHDEIAAERRQAIRRRRRRLEARAADVSTAKEALRDEIAASPELFVKPRTRALEGIKVGFRKLPGRFEMADEARSIKRIRERMPEREDEFVRIKESVDRGALKKLATGELARIGVTLVETGEEVVIAIAKTDNLDKLVEALFADCEGDAA